MNRKILHLDLDAFFCAVEEQFNPSLKRVPFAVGGSPEGRGVVSSCSYAARQFGVRSALPMARALILCPGLIVVSSRHRNYSKVSKQVMDLVHDLTPLVEQMSIDEAFLDISDLPESPEKIAGLLQERIQTTLNLPCSIGVATNKLVAKIANDIGKAAVLSPNPPNAITVVPPGQEAEFLEPLPVQALSGIGPKTARKMAEIGVRTIGHLAKLSEQELLRHFGTHGIGLQKRARGIDNRQIITFHEAKSISQEVTFAKDVTEEQKLYQTLYRLSEKVGKRLRKSGKVANTVKIKVRWSDFTTFTRQVSFDQPTDQDTKIYSSAQSLLQKVWQKGRPVRLIGVGVTGLQPPIRQISFFDDPAFSKDEKEHRLQDAIDVIRSRFGDHILERGISVKKISPNNR